jgi:ABC-type xylose transport system permease subunit
MVGVLGGLNLLLSGQQKDRINDFVLRLWAFLDYAKGTPWLAWLRRFQAYILGASVVTGVFFIYWTISHRVPSIVPTLLSDIIFGVLLVIVCMWFGYRIIRQTLRARSLGRASLRATVYLVLVLLPSFALIYVALHYQAELTHPPNPPTIFQAIWVILFIASVLLGFLVLIFWAAIAIPLALAIVLAVVLAVIEFIVRRIAEYPPGPILGVSVLCGAIVAILKLLTGG